MTNAEVFSSLLAETGQLLPGVAAKVDRLMADFERLSKELSAAATMVTRLGTSLEKMTGKARWSTAGPAELIEQALTEAQLLQLPHASVVWPVQGVVAKCELPLILLRLEQTFDQYGRSSQERLEILARLWDPIQGRVIGARLCS